MTVGYLVNIIIPETNSSILFLQHFEELKKQFYDKIMPHGNIEGQKIEDSLFADNGNNKHKNMFPLLLKPKELIFIFCNVTFFNNERMTCQRKESIYFLLTLLFIKVYTNPDNFQYIETETINKNKLD